jgi:hypothetical protein
MRKISTATHTKMLTWLLLRRGFGQGWMQLRRVSSSEIDKVRTTPGAAVVAPEAAAENASPSPVDPAHGACFHFTLPGRIMATRLSSSHHGTHVWRQYAQQQNTHFGTGHLVVVTVRGFSSRPARSSSLNFKTRQAWGLRP